MTNDIEVLKLVKLGSHKHIDKFEKDSYERNRMDIIDDEEYDAILDIRKQII